MNKTKRDFLLNYLEGEILQLSNERDIIKKHVTARSYKIAVTTEKFFRHCYNMNFDQIKKYHTKLKHLHTEAVNDVLFCENGTDIGPYIIKTDKKLERLDSKMDQSGKTWIDTIANNQKHFDEVYECLMTYKIYYTK